MTTKKEREKQIKYMLENKTGYLKNGTTEEEFNRRLKLLKQPEKKHSIKISNKLSNILIN